MLGTIVMAQILVTSQVLPPPVIYVPGGAGFEGPVSSQTLPRGPVPRSAIRTWALPKDYPLAALRNGEAGITGFMLSVNAKGEVTGCTVVSPSGSALLDETTCAVVSRQAAFDPALNGKGRPVSGSYTNKVRWVLPMATPVPVVGGVSVTYVVERDGVVTGCKVLQAEGALAAQVAGNPSPCPLRMREPFRDEHLTPVRRKVTVSRSVSVEPMEETSAPMTGRAP